MCKPIHLEGNQSLLEEKKEGIIPYTYSNYYCS